MVRLYQMRPACKSREVFTLQMKSPLILQRASLIFYVFDSVFKEYSDPDYPRSDVAKLCVLLSGGVSAIIIALLLKSTSGSGISERYSLLHPVMLRWSIFHTVKPPNRIYLLPLTEV
jgi:hypothetical protein